MSEEQLGFGNHSNSIYCRMSDGKVCRTSTEGTPGVVKVEKKKNGVGTGEYKYEIQNSEIAGYIVNFSRKTHPQWGTTLSIELDMRSEQNVMLQMNEGDRYWRAFMLRLPNIDLTKAVRFKPYAFVPAGEQKRRIGLNIEQGGVKIEAKWNKDNPGQLPPPTRPVVKGKEVWDFYAQDEWLNLNVLLVAAASLGKEVATTESGPQRMENPPDGYVDPEGNTDEEDQTPPF